MIIDDEETSPQHVDFAFSPFHHASIQGENQDILDHEIEMQRQAQRLAEQQLKIEQQKIRVAQQQLKIDEQQFLVQQHELSVGKLVLEKARLSKPQNPRKRTHLDDEEHALSSEFKTRSRGIHQRM